MLEGTLSKRSTHSPWETRGTKGDEERVGATSYGDDKQPRTLNGY